MANLCLAAVEELHGYLLASDGINAALTEIGARDGVHLPLLEDTTVLMQYVSPRLVDENAPLRYPAVYAYCDRMDNLLLQKFAKFSGPLFVVAEVRVSGEKFRDLHAQLARYVEAAATVLGAHHGQWTENLAYSGAYKIRFGEVQLGGANFIQTARIEVELQAHA